MTVTLRVNRRWCFALSFSGGETSQRIFLSDCHGQVDWSVDFPHAISQARRDCIDVMSTRALAHDTFRALRHGTFQ